MPDENDLTPEFDEEAPEGATPEDEAAGDEVDPAAALAARFDLMEVRLNALSGLDVNGVRSALGRIPALQSSLDELTKRDPAALLDPRVSASESAVSALAEALLNDPTISDATRASISGAVRGVEQARTAREADRREAALLEKMRAAVAPVTTPPANDAETEALWQRVSAAVLRRAAVLNVDPKTIPWDDIQRNSNYVPEDASTLAVEWLLEHKEDAPTARVSARKTAAGGGSPTREAGTGGIEQLRARAMTESIPITDKAAREKLAADLGVSL